MVVFTSIISRDVARAANGSATQTPHQTPSPAERTKRALLGIIRANFNTQYAIQAPNLSAFRDAVSAHGGIGVDATLLADFQTHVPLSNYNGYKPFVDKFNMEPCKKEEVENLLAPGLPEFLATTSATTGTIPKVLPKYNHDVRPVPPRYPLFDPNNEKPLAAIVYCGCTDVKEIEHAPGQVAQKIPVSLVSGGSVRRVFGWKFDDDQSRVSLTMQYYAVPWAATTIFHLPSFLTIHGLFFLAHRDVEHFYVPFATLFVDLFRRINEQWDTLVSCIRDGVLPDLEGIDHVRGHLQAQFYADPKRAAELLEIGSPFSLEGWAARVWPKVNGLFTVCSGPFGNVLPKIRSVLGPNASIRCPGYGSTEATIGVPHDLNKPDEFVLGGVDVVEFLDVSRDETHEHICQAWEVEVGKQYEPILTTRDGLWRYQLGDVVSIIGFSPDGNSPVFTYAGRKSSRIQLPHAQIDDFSLLEGIKIISSKDTIQVQEFTSVLDDRTLPPTVGFFIELAGPLGPNAHRAPQQLFNVFVATAVKHQHALQLGQIRLPTIRIVKAGTFAAYRHWRADMLHISSGQTKVPTVLVDPAAQEWMSGRVVQQL